MSWITKPHRKQITESIIELMKIWLVIKPLQFLFSNKTTQSYNKFKSSSEDSVGKDLYYLLEKNNLKLIPFYENHDLKHLILGYGMSSKEELRMQVYLLGNGNRSVSCVLFVLSGLLLPSSWKLFYQDYIKGKNAPSIIELSIDTCWNETTESIQKKYTTRNNKSVTFFQTNQSSIKCMYGLNHELY
jgi:hypothetical protein